MKTYETLEDKPFDSHYLHVETILDFPVAKIWKHAVNIGSWMTDHRLETLSGKAGEVGHFERVFESGLPEATPPPRYHLYGIAKLIPYKCIMLEVFPEMGGSYGKTREWMMFDNIILVDLEMRTKLIFLAVDVYLGRSTQPEPNDDELMCERLNHYFENLRHLVEKES